MECLERDFPDSGWSIYWTNAIISDDQLQNLNQ